MNINWKDFGIICIIGALLFLITSNISYSIEKDSWPGHIVFIISTIVSLGYYFSKNKCELKEAAFISIIFTVVLLPLSWFFLFIISSDFAAALLLIPMVLLGLPFGYFGIVLLIIFILIVGLSIGLIIWFAVNKLKWEKS